MERINKPCPSWQSNDSLPVIFNILLGIGCAVLLILDFAGVLTLGWWKLAIVLLLFGLGEAMSSLNADAREYG